MSSLFTTFTAGPTEEAAFSKDQQSGSLDELRSNYLAALRDKAVAMQNDGNFDLSSADIRFSTALNLAKVRNSLVAIIGAGGLGNWQWRILAAMGFRRIAIYDDDVVGIENVGPQAHSVFDIGLPKTEAVENAALMYRGIKIIGRNKRVFTYKDICDDLGENPDIVIGCTDSADFRNRFIATLAGAIDYRTVGDREAHLPELFIDYRMSLGDWVAYIIPAKALCSVPYLDHRKFIAWYKKAAVFSEEQAVQEPCTERAIAYTGANVASFTGGLLHWFYSGGRSKFHDQDYLCKFMNGETGMPARKISFSSRDFEFITDTLREKKLSERVKRLQDQIDASYDLVRAAFNLPPQSVLIDSGWGLPTDFYEKYRGKVIVLPGSSDVFLCGHKRCLKIAFEYSCNEDESSAAAFVQGFTAQHEPNTIQPFMVYDLPEYVKDNSCTLRVLNAKKGDIFKIDYDNRRYLRIGDEMIETLTRDNYDNQWRYSRIGWDSNYDDLHTVILCHTDEIEERFNAHASQYDSDNANRDMEERNAGQVPLAADNLQPGMTVSINDELVEILSVGAAHFQVKDGQGERINYSLRRMPEVFMVNG